MRNHPEEAGIDRLPSRETPLPADWTVAQGLGAYLAENGFTPESYDSKWTPASLLGVAFSVPNTPRHRWAIMLHDLHHVATGFGTDPAGEGELSAFELRRGIGPLGWYVGGIVLSGALSGLLFAPRRTMRAWRAAGRCSSLFHERDIGYDDLLRLSIGELRARLGLPREGLGRHYRGSHSLAPKLRANIDQSSLTTLRVARRIPSTRSSRK